MKYCFTIIMMALLCACGNDIKNPAPVSKQDSLEKPDTIRGKDISSHPSIPDDIVLDTISIKPTIHHVGIDVTMPVISPKDWPWVYNQLDSIKKYSMQEFKETVNDDTVYEENQTLYGFSLWVGPRSVYKTDSIISIVMENSMGSTGFPSSFGYTTINFDRRTRKKIEFADYFVLDTPADSTALSTIISLIGYNQDPIGVKKYWELYGEMNFAFDKENVYFCFDKGHLFSSGITAFRKKYISHLIRKEFR
jgi:hypothetical protein